MPQKAFLIRSARLTTFKRADENRIRRQNYESRIVSWLKLGIRLIESLDPQSGVLNVHVIVFVLPCYIPCNYSPGEGFPYKKDGVLVVPFKG